MGRDIVPLLVVLCWVLLPQSGFPLFPVGGAKRGERRMRSRTLLPSRVAVVMLRHGSVRLQSMRHAF